jgi:hypothetical protein
MLRSGEVQETNQFERKKKKVRKELAEGGAGGNTLATFF